MTLELFQPGGDACGPISAGRHGRYVRRGHRSVRAGKGVRDVGVAVFGIATALLGAAWNQPIYLFAMGA